MEENKKGQKKLSYEELQNVASQLSQQNQQLNIMLQQANMTNIFKRLDYLFKVLENKDCFDSDFVITCSDEIKDIITGPVEETKEEEEKGA